MIFRIAFILALTLTCPLLAVAQSPDCDNDIHPGLICCNQTLCRGELPQLLIESEPPSGGSGTIEYSWLKLRLNPDGIPQWEIIPGAYDSTYQADTLSATAYFQREVRREGCLYWLASNVITITVLSPKDPACAASAVVQPGAADGLAAVRISPNPFQEKFAVYNYAAQAIRVQVFNTIGVLMADLRLPAGQETNVVAQAWPAGSYAIHMTGAAGEQRSLTVVKM